MKNEDRCKVGGLLFEGVDEAEVELEDGVIDAEDVPPLDYVLSV